MVEETYMVIERSKTWPFRWQGRIEVERPSGSYYGGRYLRIYPKGYTLMGRNKENTLSFTRNGVKRKLTWWLSRRDRKERREQQKLEQRERILVKSE